MTRIVIVGGGITGLAAAWELRGRADVTLLEAGDRLGGKIETIDFAGRRVDTGPDAFIARVPFAAELCREAGLGADLSSPATGEASVWTRGRLRPLPAGLVLGVPSRLGALARSGILGPAGVARAAADLVLPRRRAASDTSVGTVVRHRLGAAAHERLVDALLGGINAGRTDDLSITAGAPQLAAIAAGHRSLIRGAAAARAAAQDAGTAGDPVFLTVPNGLDRLVRALAEGITAAGGIIRTDAPVAAIEGGGSGRYRVTCTGTETGAETIDADGVIVTTPAYATAPLLRYVAPEAAAAIEAIDYSSVALTLLAYPAAAFPRPFHGSGYLVPRVDGRLTTAVSWASSKWRHLAGDPVILRVSAGRWEDERAIALADDELAERLHAELVDATGLQAAAPDAVHVRRWGRGFPQYRVGHLDRVAGIEASLRDTAPALAVAGAACRGLGIPACVQQGRAAAVAVLESTGR